MNKGGRRGRRKKKRTTQIVILNQDPEEAKLEVRAL